MLKLFHGNKLIGIIRNEVPDDFAFVGDIELTPEADEYKDVFAFFADEERGSTEEPPFEEKWYEDWRIEDQNGKQEEIFIPSIYPDGMICWR
jgi:hypothetical protein